MAFTILAHGGATAGPLDADGPRQACDVGLALLSQGSSCLDAAVEACRLLEEDGRFNAGRGSHLRLDGKTVEMDAACMTADGKYGGVVCVRDVRNPILAARAVYDTPHNTLVGEGATTFARRLGLPRSGKPSAQALRHTEENQRRLRAAGFAAETGWRLEHLLGHWNYAAPIPALLAEADTVGALATDGATFAAAASTGGLSVTLLGRASDLSMIGAGLYAGPHGAVAATGQGEHLARHLVALGTYRRMEAGASAAEAVAEMVRGAPPRLAVGLIALGLDSHAGDGNCGMPWAAATGA